MERPDDTARQVAEGISDVVNVLHAVVVDGGDIPGRAVIEEVLAGLLASCTALTEASVRSSLSPTPGLMEAIRALQSWNRTATDRQRVVGRRLMEPILTSLLSSRESGGS
jgi:hypothetical protein